MSLSSGSETMLGLGTATLLPGYGLGASDIDRREKVSLLRSAVDCGIRYIDTSAAYGESEELLGKVGELLSAHRVRVCTKIAGDAKGTTIAALRGRLDTSLERLARVDTVLLHSAKRGELTDPAIGELFEDAKRERRIFFTGASTYGLEDARLALASPWCDVLQVEHSILNQSVVRSISRSLRKDQELVVRSVLCKGLLTGRRGYAPSLLRELGSVIDELERMAAEWGYSLPELAIRFALDTPRVSVVLVGVSNRDELEVALRALDRKALSPEQMQILGEFDRSDADCTHPERWADISA